MKAVAVLTFSNHDGGVNHVVLRKIGPGRYDYESYSADRVAVSGDAANLAAMGTLKVACMVSDVIHKLRHPIGASVVSVLAVIGVGVGVVAVVQRPKVYGPPWGKFSAAFSGRVHRTYSGR